jgi:ABC-type nitrate/sulfonate/bicarbonate transport system permease component
MSQPRRHHVHAHVYKNKWHLLATIGFVITPFLFLLVFAPFARIAFSVLIWDVLFSSWRLAVAYVIALVLAWVMAVSFYRGPQAVIALPLFDVLQSFPTFAALPLAVTIWGESEKTVIFFLVLTVIWPIFFSIFSSLKLMKKEWYEAVEVSRLSGWQYIRLFLLPVSIPGLITGSVVGLGEGWEALVATEIIVQSKIGLGSFFQAHSSETMVTAFGILGFLLLIFSINKLLWLPLLEWSHHYLDE